MFCKMSVLLVLFVVSWFEKVSSIYGDFSPPLKNADYRKPYAFGFPSEFNPFFPLEQMFSFPDIFPPLKPVSWQSQHTCSPPSWCRPPCHDLSNCCLYCEDIPLCSRTTTTTTTTTTTQKPPHTKPPHTKPPHTKPSHTKTTPTKHTTTKPPITNHPFIKVKYHDDDDKYHDDGKYHHSKSWKDDFYKGSPSTNWEVSMADGGVNPAAIPFLYGPRPEHLFSGFGSPPL